MPSTYIWPERKEQIPPGEVDAHDWGLLGSERREPVLVRRVRLDRRVVRDVDLKVFNVSLDFFAEPKKNIPLLILLYFKNNRIKLPLRGSTLRRTWRSPRC